MSWNVSLEAKPCPHCGRIWYEDVAHGLTWNLAWMFHHALGTDLRSLKGRKAADVIECLQNAVQDMVEDPDFYRAMEPDNGWGSYEGALSFLRDLLQACQDGPDGIIDIR